MPTTPIPDGPASVYLKLAAALAALIAAVAAILHGDHSETTLAAGLAGAGFLITFALGKYAQATALIRAHGNPGTTLASSPARRTPR